jgi:hypothetical protein
MPRLLMYLVGYVTVLVHSRMEAVLRLDALYTEVVRGKRERRSSS